MMKSADGVIHFEIVLFKTVLQTRQAHVKYQCKILCIALHIYLNSRFNLKLFLSEELKHSIKFFVMCYLYFIAYLFNRNLNLRCMEKKIGKGQGDVSAMLPYFLVES